MVTQSIEAQGFTNQLDSLSYHKTTQLFYPDGSLEKILYKPIILAGNLLLILSSKETKSLTTKTEGIFFL